MKGNHYNLTSYSFENIDLLTLKKKTDFKEIKNA